MEASPMMAMAQMKASKNRGKRSRMHLCRFVPHGGKQRPPGHPVSVKEREIITGRARPALEIPPDFPMIEGMFETLTQKLNEAVRQLSGRGRISEANVADAL